VTKFVVVTDDSWIPDEFKEAIKDTGEGRFVDGNRFERNAAAAPAMKLPGG
jgi:hypothetical protein